MSSIETPRLLVRKWDIARDLDDACAIYGDPETMRFIPCGPLSREHVEALLQRMAEHDARFGFGIWAVELQEETRVVGECGISHIPPDTPDIELGWIFHKNYLRRGYATEAAGAVISFAFETLRLPRLYALIDRENAPSIRLANRLEMRYDRIVRAYKRDLMRYAKERL